MAKSMSLVEMLNTLGTVHANYKDSWAARPFSLDANNLVLRKPDTPFDADTIKHLKTLGWYQVTIITPNDEDWYYDFDDEREYNA